MPLQRKPVTNGSWIARVIFTALVVSYCVRWIADNASDPSKASGIAFTILAILLLLLWLLTKRPATEDEVYAYEKLARQRDEEGRDQERKAAVEPHDQADHGLAAPEARSRSEEKARRKHEKRMAESRRHSEETIRKAEAAKRMRKQTGAGPNYDGPRCPRCCSIYFQVLGDDGKPLSAGKAIVGNLVAGPTGMFIGAAMGKKAKRYKALCSKCGKSFQFKA